MARKVNPELLSLSVDIFSPNGAARTYSPAFAQRRLHRDKEIFDMHETQLISAWESCIGDAITAKVAVDEEISKGAASNVASSFHSSHRLY